LLLVKLAVDYDNTDVPFINEVEACVDTISNTLCSWVSIAFSNFSPKSYFWFTPSDLLFYFSEAYIGCLCLSYLLYWVLFHWSNGIRCIPV